MNNDNIEAPQFLGLRIKGDIRRQERPAQKSLEEFKPIIQALLDDPGVHDFGWRQYTPHFNDGEPCVFRAYGTWLRTANDMPEADNPDEDDEESHSEKYSIDIHSDHPTLGRFTHQWNNALREYEIVSYTGTAEAEAWRARSLASAIEDQEFDDVLLSLFGDHAEVHVTRAGIEVTLYDHD